MARASLSTYWHCGYVINVCEQDCLYVSEWKRMYNLYVGIHLKTIHQNHIDLILGFIMMRPIICTKI